MIIYKYPLKITDFQLIRTPDYDAVPLSVGCQNGELVMWVQLDERAEQKGTLGVSIIGTGNPAPASTHDFVGTVQMPNGLVWHVYTAKLPEDWK